MSSGRLFKQKRPSKYSLGIKYRVFEKWLRKAQHTFACTIMVKPERVFTEAHILPCNCIWSGNKPLIKFWNCRDCMRKPLATLLFDVIPPEKGS